MDGWFALATPAARVVIMDPYTGGAGTAQVRQNAAGRAEVKLRLEPAQSIILRTYATHKVEGTPWHWTVPGQKVGELRGPWRVQFIEGGPVLPRAFETASLGSWTANGDPEAERFGGTAIYRTTFDAPTQKSLVLDLGEVKHSARVRVNGREIGALIMHPYRVPLDQLKPQGNQLEIEVTNLSANRIRDLDRRKVPWRNFHDANVVNINYKPFDAANWPVFESGLIGPVTLRAEE
jgi:hypothetical protein